MQLRDLTIRFRLRWQRRRLLWRAIRSRHALRALSRRAIPGTGVLCLATVRDERARLPHWLDHARGQGVGHFLIVDNGSTDGTAELLAGQPDVSLWTTEAAYGAARFGMDWLGWLLWRYGHGRWCLILDADELLVYPHCDTADLTALTQALEARGQRALGCLMLDLYPEGPLGAQRFGDGDNPLDTLRWFDAGPFRATRQAPRQNLWVQGGARERVFFADAPRRSPTLNKLPLIRWDRGYAFTNSTHAALPVSLNHAYDGPQDRAHLTGALLHTKFLPSVVERSAIEKARKQHFTAPERFEGYYDAIMAAPVMRHRHSIAYSDWRQLVDLGLIHDAGWTGS